MVIDSKNKTEDLKISYFHVTQEGVGVLDLLLTLEKGTSTVAVSAMLKGLEEFYMKPAGIADETPAAEKEMRDKNLKLWAEHNQKKTSKLILP